MENKNVGYLLIGVSIIMVFIIFLFNNAMKDIVSTQCGEAHAPTCPMNKTINDQTNLSLGITGIILIIAIFLIFSKQSERVVLKKVEAKTKKREYNLSGLKQEEKQVFALVQKSGAAFQADIIDKTGFGKAKMTRIIDRLEGRGLVERKRRGMTNVIVIKN